MNRVFERLNEVIENNKKSDFREYINRYKDIKKWVICSDYCIGDKNKNNDVITFTLFPYVYDLKEVQSYIELIAKTDIKKARVISDEFCNFYHCGLTYSFSFILDKNNFIRRIFDRKNIEIYLSQLLKMVNRWIENEPDNKHYIEIRSILQSSLKEVKRPSANIKLFREIIYISFIVSDITYLLKEYIEIELVGWFSDIDKITTAYNRLAFVLYNVQRHCLCVYKFGEEYKKFEVAVGSDEDGKIFWEGMNRIPDYLCGFLSDYNIGENGVTKEKFCKVAEKIVADNKYISIYKITEDGIKTINVKKS